MMWWDLVAFGIFISVIFYLVFRLYKLRKTNHELIGLMLQMDMDKTIFSDQVAKLTQELENKKLEGSDGFLKFVSESRDWAFNYIETTQEEIKKFSEIMEKEKTYHRTYGTAAGAGTVHSIMLDRVFEAYEDLARLLPKEEQTNTKSANKGE